MLASGGSYADRVSLYDLRTKRTQTLRMTVGQLSSDYIMSSASVSFSPDGRTLVNGGSAVDAAVGQNGSLNLWDGRTGAHLRLFAEGWVTGPAVTFSPDGKMIATGGHTKAVPRADFGKQIVFWDAKTGSRVATLQTPSLITALAFSPDGRYIASGGVTPDASVKVWNVRTRRKAWSQRLPSNLPLVSSLQFSPDGRLLASGSQGRIVCLWAARSGRLESELAAPAVHDFSMGNEDVALDVAFSPDGRLLAAGGLGGVNLWSVASRKRVHALYASAPVAFFRDGAHLATLDRSRIGRNHVVVWTIR